MTVQELNVEVISLTKLRHKASLPYSCDVLMKEWVEDENITTPDPAIKINGELYWADTNENIDAFVYLWNVKQWLEAQSVHEKLEGAVIPYAEIVGKLVKQAEFTRKLNSRAYRNNRSNSLSDAKRRIHELKGKRQFVADLLREADLEIPPASAQQFREHLRAAAKHAELEDY